MKNMNHLKYILPTLLLAACGGSKTPIANIDQLRADAKLEAQRGPDAPRVQKEYYGKEERVEVLVGAAQAKVGIALADGKIPQFFEGSASSVKFIVTSPAGSEVKLTAINLPKGAQGPTKVAANTYEVKWTPAY